MDDPNDDASFFGSRNTSTATHKGPTYEASIRRK